MAVWRGDYGVAEKLASEAAELSQRHHDIPPYTSACMCLGIARMECGRYQAARAVLQLGLDAAGEAGERRNVAKLLNTMGALYEELGDFDAARQWNHRALDATRSGTDASVMEAERYTLLNLASTELRAGDVAAAERNLSDLEPLLDLTQYSRFRYLNRYQLLRAEIAVVNRDSEPALRWSDEAQALAEAKRIPKNVAKSLMLRGRAMLAGGSEDAAVAELQRAVSVADSVGHAALGWQSRFWLAQALRARRPGNASEVQAEAVTRIDAIARELSDLALRERFLDSPLVRALQNVAPPAKASNPAGLSAREVQVLRLVASGTTRRGSPKCWSSARARWPCT
jgi:ATP/maltotriose-dependent transcriptional regulator MalT